MIRTEYKGHPQALQWACLEACLEHLGMFQYKYLAHVFTQHEKQSARVIKAYKEINPGSLSSTRMSITPSKTFTRQVLTKSADPEHFLVLLYLLYNVDPLDDL